MTFSRKNFIWVLGVCAVALCLFGGAGVFGVSAGGVIDDAPTFAQAFLRLLDFLLEIFGFLVILTFVIAGILYFTAGGNVTRLELAKKAFTWAVVGVVVGLGAFVLVLALAKFFAE
jgi:hypothetical protein